MGAQILIEGGENWFEFSKSKTGQLDYIGKWGCDDCDMPQSKRPDVDGYQVIASSTYFSPARFSYLSRGVAVNPKVYVAPDVDVSDKDTLSYLVHAGAMLCAVEDKDSMLCVELLLKRFNVFNKFSQMTQFILSPIAVEVLFTLVYARMESADPKGYPMIFETAKKVLNYDSSKETLEQAFIRYMKKNQMTLTLPLVGTEYAEWGQTVIGDCMCVLNTKLDADDILNSSEKIRNAKRQVFENLEVALQAEPYNVHDRNSIVCSIEDVEAKLLTNPGLVKAGHIRATAAAIIRESKPEKISFKAKLQRVCYDGIVVKIEI